MRILIAVSGSNDGSSDPVAAAASIPWPEGTEFRVLTITENVHPPVVQLLERARDVSDVQHAANNVAANTVASAVAQLQSRGFHADGASPEGDPKFPPLRETAGAAEDQRRNEVRRKGKREIVISTEAGLVEHRSLIPLEDAKPTGGEKKVETNTP